MNRSAGSDIYVYSYLNLRAALGIIAVALPVLVCSIGWAHQIPLLTSISAYYHPEPTRNWFVAALCSIGLFLFTYRGYPDEVLIHRFMGVFAFGIALIPTTCPKFIREIAGATDLRCGSSLMNSNVLHLICAISFFLCMAYMAIVLFPKNQGLSNLSSKHEAFNARVYRACGWAILIAGALFVLRLLYLTLVGQTSTDDRWFLVVEVVSIWAFGIAWLLKSHLIYRLFKKQLRRVFLSPK